jgi:hypothetical protein
MELNISNKSENNIIVFGGQKLITDATILKMLKPQDMLQRVAYDYYWYNRSTYDLSNFLQHRLSGVLQYCGEAAPNAIIQLPNVVQPIEYFYVFYLTYSDNSSVLNLATIPARLYYSYVENYTISIFNINYAPVPRTGNQFEPSYDVDEVNQILNLTVTNPGSVIDSIQLDWKPKIPGFDEDGGHWKHPLIYLVFIIILIIAIVVCIGATFALTGKIIFVLKKETTEYTKKEEVEEPKLYLS